MVILRKTAYLFSLRDACINVLTRYPQIIKFYTLPEELHLPICLRLKNMFEYDEYMDPVINLLRPWWLKDNNDIFWDQEIYIRFCRESDINLLLKYLEKCRYHSGYVCSENLYKYLPVCQRVMEKKEYFLSNEYILSIIYDVLTVSKNELCFYTYNRLVSGFFPITFDFSGYVNLSF